MTYRNGDAYRNSIEYNDALDRREAMERAELEELEPLTDRRDPSPENQLRRHEFDMRKLAAMQKAAEAANDKNNTALFRRILETEQLSDGWLASLVEREIEEGSDNSMSGQWSEHGYY